MEYRKFIKVTIIAFMVASIILFILPKQWSYIIYHPVYLGVMFLISAILIYLSRFLFRSDIQIKKDASQMMQVAIGMALILNGLGELGLYQLYRIGFEYDKMAHLISAMLFTIALVNLLNVWKNISFKQTVWRVALIVFVAGIGWELWERLSDILFHTQEWGIYGQDEIIDTIGDVMWNCVGIIFGIIFYHLKNKQKYLKIDA